MLPKMTDYLKEWKEISSIGRKGRKGKREGIRPRDALGSAIAKVLQFDSK